MTENLQHDKRTSRTNRSTARPLISVIIPTKNSAMTLGRAIDSIRHQTYEEIEVLVVDNFSTDGTPNLARKLGAKVFLSGPERSAQINLGASKAMGKYVYRVDSDTLLEPSVIEECVNKCEEENFSAVTVHNTSEPTVSFWASVRRLERDMYIDDTNNIGANFVRRDVFLNLGGLDEKLVACEDYDFQLRLSKAGFRYARVQGREIHFGEPRTLREVVNKHYYYGKTIRDFLKKDPENAARLLNPIRPAYLRHRKEWFKDPKFLVGFFVYQIVRYEAALLGLLRSFQR